MPETLGSLKSDAVWSPFYLRPGGTHQGGTASSFTSGTAYFWCLGRLPFVSTTAKATWRLSGQGTSITWAELAIFSGELTIGGDSALTRRGFTDIAAAVATTAADKLTTITVSGITAGMMLWLCFGCASTGTMPQLQLGNTDTDGSGETGTIGTQPSLISASTSLTHSGGGSAVRFLCSLVEFS